MAANPDFEGVIVTYVRLWEERKKWAPYVKLEIQPPSSSDLILLCLKGTIHLIQKSKHIVSI